MKQTEPKDFVISVQEIQYLAITFGPCGTYPARALIPCVFTAHFLEHWHSCAKPSISERGGYSFRAFLTLTSIIRRYTT